MIRRVIWLLIILGIAYGVYKLVDPTGAQALVTRIQSYFHKEPNVSVITEQDQTQDTGEVVDTLIVYTGYIDTGSTVELDYVLSEKPQASTGTAESTGQSETVASKPTPVKTTPKPTNPSTKSLSSQDMNDTKALLEAIVE